MRESRTSLVEPRRIIVPEVRVHIAMAIDNCFLLFEIFRNGWPGPVTQRWVVVLILLLCLSFRITWVACNHRVQSSFHYYFLNNTFVCFAQAVALGILFFAPNILMTGTRAD